MRQGRLRRPPRPPAEVEALIERLAGPAAGGAQDPHPRRLPSRAGAGRRERSHHRRLRGRALAAGGRAAGQVDAAARRRRDDALLRLRRRDGDPRDREPLRGFAGPRPRGGHGVAWHDRCGVPRRLPGGRGRHPGRRDRRAHRDRLLRLCFSRRRCTRSITRPTTAPTGSKFPHVGFCPFWMRTESVPNDGDRRDLRAPGGEGASGSPAGSERAASPTFPTVHADAIAAIMGASHGDPFSVLGPHKVGPNHGGARRAAGGPRRDLILGERTVPFEKRHADGFFVARVEGEGRPLYEIEIEAWDGSPAAASTPTASARPSSNTTSPACARSAPTSSTASSAPRPGASTGSTGSASPSGRRTPRRSASSATSTIGTAAATRCGLWQDGGVWELFVPGLQPGGRYKFEITGPDGALVPLKADPVAFAAEHPPATGSILHGLGRSIGATTAGWAAAAPRIRATPRSRSTRSISARGCGCRRRATATSPTRNWASASSLRQGDGLHPYRDAADHRVPVRRVLGLPAGLAVRRRRAASARRTSSRPSWMPPTRPASA